MPPCLLEMVMLVETPHSKAQMYQYEQPLVVLEDKQVARRAVLLVVLHQLPLY